MKNVNIKIEELDVGNNKISYKQNSSGFWRGEFTLNFIDWEKEGKPKSEQILNDVIKTLNGKNKDVKK